MKKIIIFILFYICTSNVFAGFWTPGTGVVWNLDDIVANSGGVVVFTGGFYVINDTLTVAQNDTVLVLQNVRIKLAQNKFINVLGTLRINPPDSVKVTALDTALKYVGFRFDQYSGSSLLKKMIMEYGNSVRIYSANIIIDSCIFRFNTFASSLSSGTVYVSNAAPQISKCRFIENRRSAIMSASNGTASPVILGNIFFGNNVNNENYPQINLGAGGATPIIIRGNTIIGNPSIAMSGGIAISTLVGGSVSCLVENNNIRRNRYGIAFIGTNINGLVSRNTIDSNNTQGLPLLGGSGINFLNSSSTGLQQLKVKKNIIRWNLWGVTVQNYAKPILGISGSTDTNDVGQNSIYNNGHNDSTIELAYSTTVNDTLKAELNWWGTSNSDSIAAHILERNDGTSYGIVDYTPFQLLSGINNPPAEQIKDFVLYDAYPNPFNPSTVVRYQLSVVSQVSLKVYNILGKEVAVLVNEKLSPGTYEVTFDGSNLASGIYFVQMQAGNFLDVKKIILMK
jgi:hypothetical protein